MKSCIDSRITSGLFVLLRWFAFVTLLASGIGSAWATKTFNDNGDGTVTDPTTGLVWMRCAMGQNWDGTTCFGTPRRYNFDEANALTGSVTFAGQSDWRIPSIRELETIVERGEYFPAISSFAFPTTLRGNFWWAAPDTHYTSYAWFVNFQHLGESYQVARDRADGVVRLVRAGLTSGALDMHRPHADYVDHGDGTVSHTPTGLMWQRCEIGRQINGSSCGGNNLTFNWDEAHLLTSNLAGYDDWRLPTAEELLSLVDYSASCPAINETLFPTTCNSTFWSSSPTANNTSYAWSVWFETGSTQNYYRDMSRSVRLVRTAKTTDGAVSVTSPTKVTAIAGNEEAIVSFTPPSATGGAPITGYTVTSSPGGITAMGSASPITVVGLTNNTSYTFTVTATNASGTSAASAASNAVTPTAANPLLQVISTGTGSGTVTSGEFPPHINCNSSAGTSGGSQSCASGETVGTTVTLTANAASGSVFTGWSGACANEDGPCLVKMVADQTVGANFSISTSPVIQPVYPESTAQVSEVMQGGQVLRWFSLKSSTGQLIVNQNLTYQISGEAAKTVVTDESGIFWIETDAQTTLTGQTPRNVVVDFAVLMPQAVRLMPHTFQVKVAPRALNQDWVVQAGLKGEAGIGPQVGVVAKIGGIGVAARAGVKFNFGAGGNYSMKASYQANDGYVYTTFPHDPKNRSFAFTETFTGEGSFGFATETSLGIRVKPKKLFGVDGRSKTEIVVSGATANSYTFPDYFSPVSPVGPCHLGWRLTESLAMGIGSGSFIDLGIAPSQWLCSTSLVSHQTDNVNTWAVGVSTATNVDVDLSVVKATSTGDKPDPRFTKLTGTAGVEGGLLLTQSVTAKLKNAIAVGRQETTSIIAATKASASLGFKLTQYLSALNRRSWAGELQGAWKESVERQWAVSEEYNASNQLTKMAWQQTLANGTRITFTTGSPGILPNWGGTDTVEDSLTIETSSAADAAKFQEVPLAQRIRFDARAVESVLEKLTQETPSGFTAPPVFLMRQTRRLTPVLDIPFDLGAALGVSLKVSGGISVDASDSYLKAKGSIAQVNLGTPRQRLFTTEYYEGSDEFLAAQAQQPTIMIEQMKLAAANFTHKLLVSIAETVNDVVEGVKVGLQISPQTFSEVQVWVEGVGSKVILTAEKWSELVSMRQTSALYAAMVQEASVQEAVVGPVHFVNVQSASGIEQDLLTRPATLSIGRVSMYVQQAGLPVAAVKQVRLYRIDPETRSKTYVGGEYASGSDQLVTSLTKTGAYVMIVDTQAPNPLSALTTVFNGAGDLKVGAVMGADVSGIDPERLSLKLNGAELLDGAQWATYFNHMTNEFEFVIARSTLLHGSNLIEFKVFDRAGNVSIVMAQSTSTTPIIGGNLVVQVLTGDWMAGQVGQALVSLSNLGADESVTITARSNLGPVQVTPGTVTVAAGTKGAVELSVQVPASAATGSSAGLIVTVTDSTGSRDIEVPVTIQAAVSNAVTLSVVRAGVGTGTITSSPAGISCGSTCSASFANGSSVTLTATPATGSSFAGWSGACSNTIGNCVVSMSAARNVTASFNSSTAAAGAPTNLTATAGNAMAWVFFTPPAGTNEMTTFVITSSPGGITASGRCGLSVFFPCAPLEVTGLTNGVSYTFTVAARNGSVTGPASVKSNSVTPIAPIKTSLFASGFEVPSLWMQEQVVGTEGNWSYGPAGTEPVASPHEGSVMEIFNSFLAEPNSRTRLYQTNSFAIPAIADSVTLRYWLFHDTAYDTAQDRIQVQVSTNGNTWMDVGVPALRFNGTNGWQQVNVDLSAFKGHTNVRLGFIGISDYGKDMYIDDITVDAINAASVGTGTFPGNRSNYRIFKSGAGFGVQEIATGSTTVLDAVASIKFDDITVNLLISDLSKTLGERDLNTLIELYVAFFNRVPEADGLAYWITEFKKGTTLAQIADSFYAAAINYTSLTGYSATMTDADFVWIIYKNVLGRTGANAPPDADVQYWAVLLSSGEVSKGSLLSTMLASAHSFAGHPTWGWVPQLLDNKVKAAKVFTLQQGLNYNTPEESIAKGMAIAAAVTSAGIDDAVGLMQLPDPSFNLLLP